MITAEDFVAKLENKPTKRLTNSDAMVILLFDIKLLMEQNNALLAQSINETDSSGQPDHEDKRWWERIFR